MSKISNLRSKLYLMLITILLTSCKKEWFDAKSDKNITVPTTVQEFEMLLDDYNRITFSSPGLGEVASDGHYTPDNRFAALADIPNNMTQKNAYTWSKKYLNTQVQDWNSAYKVIFYCNLVLDGLEKAKLAGSTGQHYNRVYGNALFHRARSNFELLQVFSPAFDPANDSPFGIPLKKSIDVAERSSRSTVHECYESIMADLVRAVTLLPDKAAPVTRASKVACWGLMARVSLILMRYNDALVYSNKVLQIHDKLVDFNLIPSNNSSLGLFNQEVLFHSELRSYTMITNTRTCFMDPTFVELYEMDDLRRSMYFNFGSSGITFKGMYTNSIILFGGLATDEIYLIKAEACARTGKIPEAMSVLNKLLRMRYRRSTDGNTTLIDRTATDEVSALRVILLERKKELVLRGIRWSDLKRLNFDSRFMDTLKRTVQGEVYELLPRSDKYAFPIPDDEIALSGITQNPGW